MDKEVAPAHRKPVPGNGPSRSVELCGPRRADPIVARNQHGSTQRSNIFAQTNVRRVGCCRQLGSEPYICLPIHPRTPPAVRSRRCRRRPIFSPLVASPISLSAMRLRVARAVGLPLLQESLGTRTAIESGSNSQPKAGTTLGILPHRPEPVQTPGSRPLTRLGDYPTADNSPWGETGAECKYSPGYR